MSNQADNRVYNKDFFKFGHSYFCFKVSKPNYTLFDHYTTAGTEGARLGPFGQAVAFQPFMAQ